MKGIADGDWKGILTDLETGTNNHHAGILACLFLSLSEAFVATAPNAASLVGAFYYLSMSMYMSVLSETR